MGGTVIAERCLSIDGRSAGTLVARLAANRVVAPDPLVQAVERNRDRFPPDFVFTLTDQEIAVLTSQIVTSNILSGRVVGVPLSMR